MSTDNTITKTDLKNILEEVGSIGGSVDSTSTPTASKVSEFDSSAHMNSTDMTSQAVSDFVDGLNVSGGLLGDYVIDEGAYTGTDWKSWYRKWNSGILEVWYSLSASLTSYASYNIGALFKVTLNYYNELGVSFVDTFYTISHEWQVSSGVAYPCGHTKSTTSVEIVCNANNTGTQTCNVTAYMCGKWK